jgi:hypothetical protein
VQLYCKYVNEYYIKENDIQYYCLNRKSFFDENLRHKDGWLQIEKKCSRYKWLDGYCLPKLIDRFEYARKDTPTKSFLNKTAFQCRPRLPLFILFNSQLLPEWKTHWRINIYSSMGSITHFFNTGFNICPKLCPQTNSIEVLEQNVPH